MTSPKWSPGCGLSFQLWITVGNQTVEFIILLHYELEFYGVVTKTSVETTMHQPIKNHKMADRSESYLV